MELPEAQWSDLALPPEASAVVVDEIVRDSPNSIDAWGPGAEDRTNTNYTIEDQSADWVAKANRVKELEGELAHDYLEDFDDDAWERRRPLYVLLHQTLEACRADVVVELGRVPCGLVFHEGIVPFGSTGTFIHPPLGRDYDEYYIIEEAKQQFARARESSKLPEAIAVPLLDEVVRTDSSSSRDDWIEQYLDEIAIQFQERVMCDANAMRNTGNLEGARDDYTFLISVFPGHREAHYNLGCVFYELGENDPALREFRLVLALDPNDKDALLAIGKVLMNLKEYEAAFDEYKKALALDPTCVLALFNLAFAATALKQYDLAQEYFTKTIQLDPRHFNAHLLLGILHVELMKRDNEGQHIGEAFKCFSEAAHLNPDYFEGDWFREVMNTISEYAGRHHSEITEWSSFRMVRDVSVDDSLDECVSDQESDDSLDS